MKMPEVVYIRRQRQIEPPVNGLSVSTPEQLALDLSPTATSSPTTPAVARGWLGLEGSVDQEFRQYGKVFKRSDRVSGARGERRVT